MLRPDKAVVPVSAITSVYKFYIYIAVLQCVFIMGLIMMALWWISDKKWVGYLCAIVVMLIQSNDKLNQISKGLLWRKSVISYGLYRKGINIPNNILLPIVASVSVLIVTSLLVRLKKKNFWKIIKRCAGKGDI